MRLGALYLLIGGCLCAQEASLAGVAVNQATGEPLSGVHIRMIAITLPAITAAYGAISDRTGHFSISGMPAGSYIPAPERAGFLYVPPKMDSALPSIMLKAGQHITDYKLEMTPRAVIAGRAVDEFGDPVPNIGVQATMVPPEIPALNMFGNLGNVRTDDRGEFRLVIAPGKYYVHAQPFMQGGNGPPEIRTDGSSEASYALTFYPSAPSADRASPVVAVAGADVSGIEIHLTRQARSRGLTLSGVVTGVPEGPSQAIIAMQFGESPQRITGSRSNTAGPAGKFAFAQLQPGYYRLSASYSSGKTQLQSQVVDVRLDGADESNVQLVLGPAAELTGTLEVAGAAAQGVRAEKRTVRLESTDSNRFGNRLPSQGEADQSGAFHIVNLPPGKFRVVVDPLPDNAYIQTVLLDGKVAADGVVDLSGGARGSRIKVTVNPNGGQLSGKVLDKDGVLLVTPLAIVMLVMEGKELDMNDPPRVTPESTYSLKGIRPGKYRLFALDAFHYIGGLNGSNGDEAREMKKLAARGEEIEIKEGDRIIKDLKVLEKEDANAKPKQ